jgi:CTP synthase (UTP-ammonia lyase)
LFISKLSCSLVGQTQIVNLTPGTRAYQAYGKEEVAEHFACNYGLNQAYRDAIEHGEIKVAGIGQDGEVRIVELSHHRFFLATLFVPQLSSSPEAPHPLITEYLKAAMAFQALGLKK